MILQRNNCYSCYLCLWLFLHVLPSAVNSQAIRCCVLANGSCRSACEKISLASVVTNPDELQNQLQVLSDLCHKAFMFPFWSCLNETLNEIDRGVGWVGRPCCHMPQSEKCKMACLQAQSMLDLTDSCRKSDEIAFYTCIEKQEAGERCCRNAQTSSCHQVCKEVFSGPFTPSKQLRDAVNKHCTQDSPQVFQCLRIYIQVTPADHPFRNMHCCDESPDPQCRETCKEVLKTGTITQDIIDNIGKGGCGLPRLDDKLWQCFLANSASVNEPGGSLIQSEKMGMDSAKLQCCYRAVTVNCQRLCEEAFSYQWINHWNDFHRLCRYQLAESDMSRCLAEVDEPCELGCQELSYCTNFNHRPTELFRSCNPHADKAAKESIKLWEGGEIRLPMMTIPVRKIEECHPDVWKAIACALQIKPCHKETHVNLICKSDCINILSKCVSKDRLSPGQTPVTLCEELSPPGNDSQCISLAPYLVESKNIETSLEVTHPCKPNRCSPNHVCMVNRSCLYGQPCVPYICVPGCKMGDISQLVVPRNSFVRVPSNTHGPKCHMVCYCNQNGALEDCVTQKCLSNDNCWYEGKKYNHNTQFSVGCATCFCYAGEVTCSKKQCGSGLPCNCPDHYVPVCGANGKTYPSVCLAKCSGLSEDQFEFGACYDSDPCSPNSCHPYHRCVPRKRVCLSIVHRSCKQYDCVDMQKICNKHPKAPVCDTDNVEHPNICWMLQKGKTIAHYGKCMPHCRANGLACGHNGETYATECAAWAERVSVDYKGACAAVGSSHGTESKCYGIKCAPLPSEYCPKVFPPGGCCPICGAALRLLYSRKLSEWSVEAVRDVNPVVVQTIAEQIRQHVKVTECEVFAYLSLESEIIVLFTTIPDSPTRLQIEACVREADKIQALLVQHSPTLLTELPLSYMTTATLIKPVFGGASVLSVLKIHLCIAYVCISFFVNRLSSSL